MPTSFSSEDLGRVFDGRVLTRGRTLVLLGAVQVSVAGDAIKAIVEDKGGHHVANITPSLLGRRVAFGHECSCQSSGCVHLAAASLAALDRYPELRRAEQTNFFDRLAADVVAPERQRLVIEVAPGEPPHACFVSFSLLGERSGRKEPTSPRKVILDATRSEEVRALARLLGGADATRTGVPAALVPQVLGRLGRSGLARWQATGKRLVAGGERSFDANASPNLPPKSAIILGHTGPWYVDGLTGAVGPDQAAATAVATPTRRRGPAPPSNRIGHEYGG